MKKRVKKLTKKPNLPRSPQFNRFVSPSGIKIPGEKTGEKPDKKTPTYRGRHNLIVLSVRQGLKSPPNNKSPLKRTKNVATI